MDNQGLKEHVDNRFNSLESKIDKYAELTYTNSNDVKWLKGHAKMSIAVVISAVGYLITYLMGK